MSASPRPPLFIGGSGGSGTRAVAAYLANAGMFIGACLNESNDSLPFAEVYDRHLNAYLDGAGFDWDAWRRDLNHAIVQHQRGWNAGFGSPWLVKNPRSILMGEALFRAVPGAQFLHVVRNGVVMAFSSNQRQLKLHGSRLIGDDFAHESLPAQTLRVWCAVNRRGLEFCRRYPERCAILRYEDFCAAPQSSMEQVGRRFGIALDHPLNSESQYHGSTRSLPDDWRDQLGGALFDVRGLLNELGYLC